LIPYRATIEQMAENFVFVVNADTVAQRKVVLGQHIQDMVIVKSGLSENEVIVVDGVQKLKPGTKVKVAPPQTPGTDSLRRTATDSSAKKSS
jgi:membrane fusion protein, multidrug efflux system